MKISSDGKKLSCGLVGLLMLTPLQAEEAAKSAEEKPPYTGTAELGYLQTTGNTETSSLKGKVNVTFDLEKWRNSVSVEGFSASTDDNTTSERYVLTAKSDYKWSKNHFFYGSFRYEDDRFSSFEYQSTLSFGYGNRLVDTKVHRFEVEFGPGFRSSKPIPVAGNPDPEKEDEVIIHVGWNYRWNFSENATFTQVTDVDSGDSNTFVVAETAITSKLTGALALKASYTVRHNDTVAVGKENRDTETTIAITYNF